MFPGKADARVSVSSRAERSAVEGSPAGSTRAVHLQEIPPLASLGRDDTRGRFSHVGILALAALLTLAACRQKMANQPRYDPYEPSDFFADGMSARPRIEGTVARGEISNNPFLDTGKINGQDGDGFPMAVTAAVIDRGQSRFNIYCSQCHGRIGDGNGMIPSRGYRHTPSFHTDKLRTAPTGHFYDVMTNGFGAMPPYRTMIPTQDRWAIVAYIRALQLSQNANAADLTAAQRARLDAPPPAAEGTEGHGATEGGHH